MSKNAAELDVLIRYESVREDLSEYAYEIEVHRGGDGLLVVPPYYAPPFRRVPEFAWPEPEELLESLGDVDSWWWNVARPRIEAAEDLNWDREDEENE